MNDTVYVLRPPAEARRIRGLDPDNGNVPVVVGRLMEEPMLAGKTGDELAACLANRRSIWSLQPPLRYVYIGKSRVVYTWPWVGVHCWLSEIGPSSVVRRVGRIEADQLILDGHHFLEHLGVGAPRA